MEEALEEEIKLTLESKEKYKAWKERNSPVSMTVSFDMGWNKRSSGNRYDSISGHAFFIGCLSKKIVAAIVSSKIYTQCTVAESNGEEPPSHVCPRNYDGSSKGMESDAALHLYKRLLIGTNKKVALKAIVADGDSSMRALLRHPDNNPKGKLPLEMPEPEWLTDPSHRTKAVAKPLYALASLPKTQSTFTNVDAMRLKRYFGYMIKSNPMNELSEIVTVSKAVVENLFNDHIHCDEKGYRPKKERNEKKKEEDSQSFYRCKRKDKKLYLQIWKVYEPFTTPKRLQ